MKTEDKITLARSHLLAEDLFYAIMSQQFTYISTTETPTISVKEEKSIIYILYNPHWANSLTTKQLAQALKHCIGHLIYNHLDDHFEKSNRMDIAKDLAVNTNFRAEDFPNGFAHPSHFGFPDGLSTMEYYNLLPEEPPEKGGDDHSMMSSEQSGHQLQKQVKEMVGYANKVSKGAGLGSGLQSFITELLKPPTQNWRSILRRFPASSAKYNKIATWKRINRRFGEEQKGHKKKCKLDILVGLDESGSIADAEHIEFMSEIKGIYRQYDCSITIAKFTSVIEKTFKYTGDNKDMRNRFSGGTLFQPVFDLAVKTRPDCIIMFTDGFNFDSPVEYKNMQKVLWVLTSDGKLSEKGRSIRLSVKEPPRTLYW